MPAAVLQKNHRGWNTISGNGHFRKNNIPVVALLSFQRFLEPPIPGIAMVVNHFWPFCRSGMQHCDPPQTWKAAKSRASRGGAAAPQALAWGDPMGSPCVPWALLSVTALKNAGKCQGLGCCPPFLSFWLLHMHQAPGRFPLHPGSTST